MLWWTLFGIIAAVAVIYAGAYRGPYRTALPSQKGTEGAKAQLRAAHAIVQRIKENYKKIKFDEAHGLLTAASRTLVQSKSSTPVRSLRHPTTCPIPTTAWQHERSISWRTTGMSAGKT